MPHGNDVIPGGWFGDIGQLQHALATVGADQDPATGRFLTYGKPVALGLDQRDVAVSPETQYSIDGARFGLAALLNRTSYGMPVTVIS